jgi:hypothetical protein
LLVATATSAFGWNGDGHQAIAEAAQSRLTDGAHAALAKILIGGTTTVLPPGKLAGLATWPDDLRAVKGKKIPAGWDEADVREAEAFNDAHRANGSWHFVNLPLGAGGYDAAAVADFRSPDDIVHAINRAIGVLESAEPPASFSKAHAVRWLVHLVGDLHEPMHVAGAYYETTAAALKNPRVIRDPAAAAKAGIVSDRGGNTLLFSTEVDNLHAAWDGCLVQLVNGEKCLGGDKTFTALSRKLTKLAKEPAAAAFGSTGDHRQWAARWATDSLKAAVAAEAYGVKLAEAHVHSMPSGERFLQAKIVAPSKTAYTNARIAAVRTQLVKATVRLADLLNTIDWK